MRTLITCALVLTLAACAQHPSRIEKAKAYYGSYPETYQQMVKDYMADLLFDPYTAVYEKWGGPRRGYNGGNFVATEFGYMVCVDINAKNRMGGYVGRQPYYFLIRDGEVIRSFSGRDAQRLCEFRG